MDCTTECSIKVEAYTLSISNYELEGMKGVIPIEVQLRLKLNKAGFRFEDDGKLSSITNLNPQPLGSFTSWYDSRTSTTYYRQLLT